MKKRILISNIVAFSIILISKPESFKLFIIGLVFIIIGESIRIISSACIIKNKELSVNGAYAVCRNPLYLGTFLIILGVMIQISSSHIAETVLLWILVLSVMSYVYYHTIKSEEKFLEEKFQDKFKEYVRTVPCLIPKISCLKEIFKPENYDYSAFKKNKEYRGIFGVIIIETIIFLKIYFHD